MSNRKLNISMFIIALERMGAYFVEFNESKNIIKFDIPIGSRIDDDDKLNRSSNILKKFNADTRLLIRRVSHKNIEPVAYEDEINNMFMKIMRNKKFEDKEEFISFRNEILRRTSISMNEISDILADGIINGYSIQMQLDIARSRLKHDS